MSRLVSSSLSMIAECRIWLSDYNQSISGHGQFSNFEEKMSSGYELTVKGSDNSCSLNVQPFYSFPSLSNLSAMLLD